MKYSRETDRERARERERERGTAWADKKRSKEGEKRNQT